MINQSFDIFYCIGNFARNFRSNKVKFPWAVRICEAKRTYGEATFLIKNKFKEKYKKIIKICLLLVYFCIKYIQLKKKKSKEKVKGAIANENIDVNLGISTKDSRRNC